MNFENPFDGSDSERLPEKRRTPSRLVRSAELHTLPFIDKVHVTGREHIEEIPPDRKVIVATSHITDLDMSLVIKSLGNDLDLIVSAQSTNRSLLEDTVSNIAARVAGQEHFLGIDYTQSKGAQRQGSKVAHFNPANFVEMSEAFDRGKAVMVAAHNPTFDGRLSDKGGIGAVYLAQLSNCVILPVAVNVKSEGTFKPGKTILKNLTGLANKPDADVHIGKPVTLQKIEGVEELQPLLQKRATGARLSEEEQGNVKRILEELRGQSLELINILGEMLPEERRNQ
jgi:hypothetical protein